jgi:hypothetical protein
MNLSQLRRAASRNRRGRRTYAIGVYFAAFVVLFGIAAGWGAWYSRHQAEKFAIDQAAKDADFAAGEAAGALDHAFAAVEAQLVAAAAAPTVTAAIANPGGCTLSYAGVDPFTSGHLDFIGPDGSVKCSSLASAESSTQYASVEWQRAASIRPLITGPVIDAVTGKLVVISAVPVPLGAGFVAAVLDLDTLAAGLANHFGGRTDLEFVTTTRDGAQILSRSLEPHRWVGTTIDSTRFVAVGSSGTRSDVDGTSRIYGYRAVTGLGWRVFAGADRNAALVAADAPYRRSMLIIVVSLIGMIAVAALVYRRIVGPIRSLSRSVRAQAGRSVSRPDRGRRTYRSGRCCRGVQHAAPTASG